MAPSPANVTPKGSTTKAAATAKTDGKASASSDASGNTDPTATVAPQGLVAAKQGAGDGTVDAGNSGGTPSPVATAATPTHDHAAAATTDRAASTSADSSVQTAVAIPQQLPTAAVATGQLTATAATHSVPLSGVAIEIAASVKNGKSSFEIRLDPADLGRIDVRIDVDRSGQITSHLTVEKPETLSLLQQDAPQLQRALNDAGFKTGDSGLQFSLRDQSSSGQNSGNDSNRNAQRLVISNDDTVPAVAAGRTYGRTLGSSSGVDISV